MSQAFRDSKKKHHVSSVPYYPDTVYRSVGCCLAFHANRAKKQIPDIYNVIQLSHLSSFDEPSCSGILMATVRVHRRSSAVKLIVARSIIVAIFGREPLD